MSAPWRARTKRGVSERASECNRQSGCCVRLSTLHPSRVTGEGSTRQGEKKGPGIERTPQTQDSQTSRDNDDANNSISWRQAHGRDSRQHGYQQENEVRCGTRQSKIAEGNAERENGRIGSMQRKRRAGVRHRRRRRNRATTRSARTHTPCDAAFAFVHAHAHRRQMLGEIQSLRYVINEHATKYEAARTHKRERT